jgi:hypothetical protein
MILPKDILQCPKPWVASSYNLKRWTVLKQGGHFAALEEPALLLEDMTAFFAEWH